MPTLPPCPTTCANWSPTGPGSTSSIPAGTFRRTRTACWRSPNRRSRRSDHTAFRSSPSSPRIRTGTTPGCSVRSGSASEPASSRSATGQPAPTPPSTDCITILRVGRYPTPRREELLKAHPGTIATTSYRSIEIAERSSPETWSCPPSTRRSAPRGRATRFEAINGPASRVTPVLTPPCRLKPVRLQSLRGWGHVIPGQP